MAYGLVELLINISSFSMLSSQHCKLITTWSLVWKACDHSSKKYILRVQEEVTLFGVILQEDIIVILELIDGPSEFQLPNQLNELFINELKHIL